MEKGLQGNYHTHTPSPFQNNMFVNEFNPYNVMLDLVDMQEFMDSILERFLDPFTIEQQPPFSKFATQCVGM